MPRKTKTKPPPAVVRFKLWAKPEVEFEDGSHANLFLPFACQIGSYDTKEELTAVLQTLDQELEPENLVIDDEVVAMARQEAE